MGFRFDNAPHMATYVRWGAERFKDGGRGLLLAPRGWGKTTAVSIGLGLWWPVCVDRDARIGIGSGALDHAKAIVREVGLRIEESDLIREIYGTLLPDERSGLPWTQTEKVLAGRSRTFQEATWTAFSPESLDPGWHFTAAILDDLENEKNTNTPALRQKSVRFYRLVLEHSMEPRAPVLVGGTYYDPQGLHANLYRTDFKEATLVHRAIVRDPVTGEEVSTYPSKWPLEDLVYEGGGKVQGLKTRRALDPRGFALQMMLDPSVDLSDLFRDEWVEAHGFTSLDEVPDSAVPRIGWDLAISKSSTANYTAYAVVLVDPSGTGWVVDAGKDRRSFLEQAEWVMEVWRRWSGPSSRFAPPDRVVIESVQYQAALSEMVSGLAGEGSEMIPVVSVTPHTDKVSRFRPVSTLIQTGRLRVMRSLHAIRDDLRTLRGDGRGEWDIADALGHAVGRLDPPGAVDEQANPQPSGGAQEWYGSSRGSGLYSRAGSIYGGGPGGLYRGKP